jgi:hypothetical protein
LLFLLAVALLDRGNRTILKERFDRYRQTPEAVAVFFLLLYALSIYFPVGEWRLNRWLTVGLYFGFSLLFFRLIQRRRGGAGAVSSILLVGGVYFINTYVRSSGRAAWVILYLLIYGLFSLRLRAGFIALALVIQVVTVVPWASLIRREHLVLRAEGRNMVKATEDRLEAALSEANRVFLYSNEHLPENRLAWLALSHRIPIGPSYVARSDLRRTGLELGRVRESLLAGSPTPGVLFAIGDPELVSDLERVSALEPYRFKSEGVSFVFIPGSQPAQPPTE